MDSSAPFQACTTLLVVSTGASVLPKGGRVRQESLRHLEQCFDRWRHVGEVICLLAPEADEELLQVVGKLRLKLPSAPVMIGLQSAGEPRLLLREGVQEIFMIEATSAADLDHMADTAIVRMQYELALRQLSHFDPLTGLANRSLFQDRLSQRLAHASRHGVHIGLLFVDIDRFRVVNDVYGHPIGDQLLQASSERLQQSLRRSDTVARLGGNSFAIILDGVRDAAVCEAVARKLTAAMKEPFDIAGNEIFVSVSIGIDISSDANYDAAQMVRRTELALHQVKQDGRSGCKRYSHQSSPIDKIRVGLEAALHHAMEREELLLAYQPQVSVVGNHFVGTEVLLRWQHPVLGMVSPTVFIPVLEDTGLIEPFGEWVLRQACTQYRSWLDAGLVDPQSKVSVNLSPRQFRQPDLGANIRRILKETGLPPHNLTLEITESTLMYNLEQGAEMLSALRALGVKVAIDDFGTGYSSLAYLKDLPIDYLKIDRSFVKDIVDDRNDAAIANSIIALAHNLNLQVIAEGVESIEILTALQQFGCDQYQGFFYARPVSAEEIPDLVQRV